MFLPFYFETMLKIKLPIKINVILQRVFKWKGSKRHNNQTVWNLNVTHWDNEVRHREKTIGGSDVVACKCGCPYTKKEGSRQLCILSTWCSSAWEDMIEYQRGIWSKSLAARNLITRPCSLQRKNHDALARTAASVGQNLKLFSVMRGWLRNRTTTPITPSLDV